MPKKSKYTSKCACFNLRKASRVVSQFYDQHLRPAGLRGTQFAMLAHIGGLSGISNTELGEVLGMEHSTVTRNVELLAAKGFVAVTAHPDDARRRMLALTEAGQAKVAEARPMWQKAQSAFQERLGKERVEALYEILQHLIEAAK